jgi:bacterioferritin
MLGSLWATFQGAYIPMQKLMNRAAAIPALDTEATVEVLHRILHFELNGVMRHFHHRWMSRWLGSSRPRAIAIGQHIAALTGGPSLGVGQLMDQALGSADDLLDAARSHERLRLDEYRKLLELVAGRSEGLEAFARAQIASADNPVAELGVDDDDA